MSTLFLFASLFLSCTAEKMYVAYDGNTQGTSFHIIYEADSGKDLRFAIDSLLQLVNSNFSLWDTGSILSKLNRNGYSEKLPVLFCDMFRLAEETNRQSGGAFDPTVAPLVDLWGFGPGKNRKIDSSQVKEIMNYVGMDKVRIKNDRLIKDNARVSLNFNAIAQGYTVDMIADYFERIGLDNFLVEIGGEVRVKGVNKKGEKWKIGIDRPGDLNAMPGQDIQAIVSLDNMSVSTSGNYRNYFVEKGVKYSHTINPKTGMPAKSDLLSASIFTDKCAVADAYATAMMVMGREKAIKLAGRMKLDVYLIYSDEKGNILIYASDRVKQLLIK